MEDLSKYPAELLTLLAEKDFAILSPAEKSFVSKFIPEENYSKLRETYRNIKFSETGITENLRVNPQTKVALLAALNNKQTRRINILLYKIPVWQAAAAIFLFIAIFIAFNNGRENKKIVTVQTITDTVKIVSAEIKKVFIHDTIYVKTGNRKPENENQVSAYIQARENPSILSIQKITEFRQSGQSLADDSLIRKFNFVTIN